MLALFDKMRIEDEGVRDWFRAVLASQTKDTQADSLAQRTELIRQQNLLVSNQDRLLNMRFNDEIDQEAFGRKQTELRDRLASIKLQRDVVDRSHDETAELAAKVFELSQTLRQQWLTADYAAKRRILEIVLLNSRPDNKKALRRARRRASCSGKWRGQDLNLRPRGYEPRELPGCSTPRQSDHPREGRSMKYIGCPTKGK